MLQVVDGPWSSSTCDAVPVDALILALLAAVFHAGWNVLLASARDVRAATTVTLVLSVVFLAPWAAASWEVSASAAPSRSSARTRARSAAT